MTEQQLIELGYKLQNQYNHDHYTTRRYTNGPLEVEFTYSNGELVHTDVSIDEITCMPVTLQTITVLTNILASDQ